MLTTAVSGALAGVGCGIYYWFVNPAWGVLRSAFTWASIVSGVVLAGVVMYLLHRAHRTEPVCSIVSSQSHEQLV